VRKPSSVFGLWMMGQGHS